MPILALLRNRVEPDDLDSFYDDPSYARDMAFQELEPKPTSRHPDWFPTVYYDPAKFSGEVALERVFRHYAAAMPSREHRVAIPGHDYRLEAMSPIDLQRSRIVKFPLAEELFRRRGFVADVEVQGFRGGDNALETAALAYNWDVACFQLAVVEAYLKPRKATRRGKVRREANLGRLIGQDKGAPIPLVERDGVFLPCHKFWQAEQIHFARDTSLRLALRRGRRDVAGLCHASADEIEAQVQFERRNSRALFNGATTSALLLWQVQALAVLRKAAWRIDFFAGTALNTQEEIEAGRRRRALQHLRDNPALTHINPIQSGFQAALGDHRQATHAAVLDAIEAAPGINPYGVAFGLADYHHAISTEQNVVAALHGSTYRPDLDPDDRCDMMEPINWLRPLAEWIGELKRHRYGVLDEGIANLIVAVLGGDDGEDPFDPQLSSFAPMIQDRLGDVAWNVIAAAILRMPPDGSPQAVPVIYDWTRDADEPWGAERRADGTIVIRGPLLDFPASQAAHWNAKSLVLLEEGDLAFHRRRRN